MRLGCSSGRRKLTRATALGALAVAAPLSAAEMSWNGPADCQRADLVREQVESLIGRPLAELETPSFELQIAPKGDIWSLELVTFAPARSSRTLEGPSCAAVTDAAGVAMAMAIRATESAHEAPPVTEPPGKEAPPPPATTEVPPPPPAARRADLGAEDSESARLGAMVGLSATVDSATLPAPVLGLGLGAGLRYSPVRLELQGQAFAPSTVSLAEGARGEFTLLSGAALGCFEGELTTIAVLGCGGLELGRLSGEGRRVTSPHLGAALWQAVRLEAGVELPPTSGLRFTARLGVAVPLARPDFQLDGNSVHRPAAMSLRAALGVALLP